MAERRDWEPADLYRITRLSSCEISPDGERIACVHHRVDRETEVTHADIWLHPADDGEPRRLTVGDHLDATPRWSPDGRWIAFASNRLDTDRPPGLFVIPADGGEARPIDLPDGSVGEWAWAPSSDRLCFTFRRTDPVDVPSDDEDDPGRVCRHITRTFFKLDGSGYLPTDRWHLRIADVPSGEVRRLTDGESPDERFPTWSPDGDSIAFVSNRADEPDLEPERDEILVIPAEGGEPRVLETPVGPKLHPSFSPDGSRIAYYAREGRGWWQNQGLWTVPADGSAPARNLTARFDVHVHGRTIGDVVGQGAVPPVWTPSGDRVLVPVARHGRTGVRAVDPSGTADLETVLDGDRTVGRFTLSADGDRLAFHASTFTVPSRIRLLERTSGNERPVVRPNADLLARIETGHLEETWHETDDGRTIHGWVLRPPGFDPGRAHPSVLEVHGGPRVQYGHVFMHEFHVLAARGWIVHFCNPRGSQGYGEDHSRAIQNDWGGPDHADVAAWTDRVASLPGVDPDRMGVTGGSYGGFMTNWIIGHTDRFRAAVTQRCVSNLVSMFGSSDMNWWFQREFGDRPPWTSIETWWAQSPIAHVEGVETPTLVIHSEQDLRCPQEQAEQLYVALKVQGVETELVLFPDEPHGLSREGRTDRRVARLEHIARWFDEHL